MQQFPGYSEKEVLHDALSAQKSMTGLLNSFSNECANPGVRKIMLDILDDEHAIQFDVFNDMHARGYYPTTPAQQDKVCKLKDTYAKSAKSAGGKSSSQGQQPGAAAQDENTGAWHTDKNNTPLL